MKLQSLEFSGIIYSHDCMYLLLSAMRRTKADTEKTRQQILDAARRVFAERGVSRTSLEQVAAAACMSRGAIYWHFANKIELFSAMREQVSMDMFERMGAAQLGKDVEDPLGAVRDSILEILHGLEADERVREAFGILSLKCEYVGEFAEVLGRILQSADAWTDKLALSYIHAQRLGLLRTGLDPRLLAVESRSFIFGLVRLWLMDVGGTTVRPQARAMIDTHVEMRRA